MDILQVITAELKTMLVAILPVIELRGAIPFGTALGLTPWESFVFAFIGSLLPVPFLLLLIRPIFKMLGRTARGGRIVEKLRLRSISKSEGVKKYGWLGLVLFVAVPIPGTGVWGGSLLATFLNIRFKTAFPAIALGNLIAGIIVMGLTYGFVSIF